MKLNARQISSAKAKDKPYKLSDGGGLYLLINPGGSRYWRLNGLSSIWIKPYGIYRRRE